MHGLDHYYIDHFTYNLNGVSLSYHMCLIGVTGTRSIYMYAQDISGKRGSSLHGLELRSRDCRFWFINQQDSLTNMFADVLA